MKWIVIIFISMSSAFAVDIGGFEYSEQQIFEIKEGLEVWRNFAEKARLHPSPDLISELGIGLFKTSQPSIYVIGDRLEVRKELQDALLAIPGHAEYYEKQIKEASLKGGGDLAKGWSFQTLAQLPSPETVRVLGDFLADERGKRKESDPPYTASEFESGIPVPNCYRAASTLSVLIENPPVPEGTYIDAALPDWRNWYEQVKAGRRTYRFKGDPQEYNLQGPAREARNPDIPRPIRRPDVSKASTTEPSQSSSSAAPWVVGGVVVLLGVAGYCYQKRARGGKGRSTHD